MPFKRLWKENRKMQVIKKIFAKKSPNFDCLEKNGFVKDNGNYVLKHALNGKLDFQLTVSETGLVDGKICVNAPPFSEVPVTSLSSAVIRDCRKFARAVAHDCFDHPPFGSAQGERIARRIKEKYGDSPDFPWIKFPRYGVFRHGENRKWYALFMNIEPVKLYARDPSQKSRLPENILSSFEICIVDVKVPSFEVVELDMEKGIFPAYHMNARNWLTIILEDIIPDSLIMDLVAESYKITLNRNKAG